MTPEQALSFAPDDAAKKLSKGLGIPEKWKNLTTHHERAAFGELDGYKAAIDLLQPTPAFKCSCPSKKLPCKHAVGLLYLYATSKGIFAPSETMPDWAGAWVEGRDKKMGKAAANADAPPAELTPEQIAKKEKARDERLDTMQTGLDELEQWLLDAMRQGMIAIDTQPHTFWSDMAAAMVNQKLSGVATRLRRLATQNQGTDQRFDALINSISDIYLLVKAFKNIEKIPPPIVEDMMTAAGWNKKKDELQGLPSVKDTWRALGEVQGEEEGIKFRRMWVYGKNTQQIGLLLDFAFNSGFETAVFAGGIYEATVVFYPSNYPQRLVFTNYTTIAPPNFPLQPFPNLDAFADAHAHARSKNAWLRQFPLLVENIVLHQEGNIKYIIDVNQKILPVIMEDAAFTRLLVVSGGHPILIFGEWSDGQLLLIQSLSLSLS
jgi:SWIM zinc finger